MEEVRPVGGNREVTEAHRLLARVDDGRLEDARELSTILTIEPQSPERLSLLKADWFQTFVQTLLHSDQATRPHPDQAITAIRLTGGRDGMSGSQLDHEVEENTNEDTITVW